MSLLEQLEAKGQAKGRAEGKAEGKAEGSIKTILSLLKSRIISAEQAREQLEKLAASGDIPKDMLNDTLAQVSKM